MRQYTVYTLTCSFELDFSPNAVHHVALRHFQGKSYWTKLEACELSSVFLSICILGQRFRPTAFHIHLILIHWNLGYKPPAVLMYRVGKQTTIRQPTQKWMGRLLGVQDLGVSVFWVSRPYIWTCHSLHWPVPCRHSMMMMMMLMMMIACVQYVFARWGKLLPNGNAWDGRYYFVSSLCI